MIIGIGVDIVDIRRITRLWERFGSRFSARILTASEQACMVENKSPIERIAGRFAAKEACAKAIGTGFRSPINLHSVEVFVGANGTPCLHLDAGATAAVSERVPDGYVPVLHLSLSHEKGCAMASVILEARRQSEGHV